MRGVRIITWIGFLIAVAAMFSIGRVDPIVSAAIGVAGVLVSGIGLATSKP